MNKKLLLALTVGFIFASTAFAASDLGSLQESVSVGKVVSVGLNPSNTGNWYVVTNSNVAVAGASISSGALLITGKSVGSTAISACTDTQGSHCLLVTVNVGSVLGSSIVAPHPAKSWIIQGKTVFYVDVNGLIPITTWKIFLNNGGKQALIQPATSADLTLPWESFMALKDARVK